MAKKKITPPPASEIIENIIDQTLEDIMGERYATYAKYVIQDRAIPDARDGLKPVQRRIIYAMYKANNTVHKPYRKCATSVGQVMGQYHPHGDASIYDALAHMSQDWKYRHPLIDFQGNNGSIDGDNPAAHRYTEARLSEISDELIQDIEKNTVDMQLTFDDTQLEPTVLPARFPNLFVNGSSGIAVALATNIPPHNLNEVINAAIYRINHPRCYVEDVLTFIQGPDFPTGGIITNPENLNQVYATGNGRIDIIGKTEIIYGKDSNKIIITEIPYGVVKSRLVRAIDEIRVKKVIDGIIEVLDESDHQGLRISIELKKEANAEITLSYLLNKTELKSSFSANMVAIVDGHPVTLNLLNYLDAYINHQIDVVTRLSQYDLDKARIRLHLVEGMIKAISILDDVVKTIRASKDKQEALANLIREYDFTLQQAEAIVNLQLYRLTNTDVTTLKDEQKELSGKILNLESILNDKNKLLKIIIGDLKNISKKYGAERKTQVSEETLEIKTIDKRELIAKEEIVLAVTRDGYIKRSSLKSYRSSENSLPGLKKDDVLIATGFATTLDYLLAFTNIGNYLFIPIHEIAEGRWKDEGRHINYLVTMNSEEKIVRAFIISEFKAEVNVILLTKNGQIKKTSLADFFALRYSRPLGCMRLLKDDEVVDVVMGNGNNDLLILTTHGNVTLFNENELTIIGIKASGVKAIASLKKGDKMLALFPFDIDEKGKLLLVTNQGHTRIFDYNYVAKTLRLGKVQYVFKSFKSDPHELVYARKLVKGEEELKLDLLLSNHFMMDVVINDFAPVPIDRYAKRNIELPKDVVVSYVFHPLIVTIDAKTKTYLIEKETKKSEEEDRSKYKQISIFDELGD